MVSEFAIFACPVDFFFWGGDLCQPVGKLASAAEGGGSVAVAVGVSDM